MRLPSTSSWRELDRRVMEYEQALRSGSAEISRHLPSRDDPSYLDALRELVLVDAEWNHDRGRSRQLDDYIRLFPELAQDRQLSSSLRASLAHLHSTIDPNPPGAAIDFEPCEVICGFEVVELLGRGTFARVYLARQIALADRLVVIKVSNRSFGEAQKLASLRHTNIVPLFSAHESAGIHILCMPYLGRETLASRRDGSQDPRRVLALAAGLAEGLGHAHERGLLHLDVKPANVLMGDDGVPMLLDFNLSAKSGPDLVAAGGTLGYMSPEQIEQTTDAGVPLSAASDTYALGLLLFELLTGTPAFALPTQVNPHTAASLARDRRGIVPGFASRTARLGPSVRAILARALHPDPAQRYVDGNALAEDLRRELADLPLRHAGSASPLERAGKWMRRHPRATIAVAVSGAAMLAIGSTLGLYLARNAQLRAAQAEQAVVEFDRWALRARTLLGASAPTPAQLDAGRDAAKSALALFGFDAGQRPHTPPARALADLRSGAGELLLLKSRAARIESTWAAPEGSADLIELARRYNLQAGELLDGEIVAVQRAAIERNPDDLKRAMASIGESDEPRAIYLRGLLDSTEGRWDRAAERFEDVVSISPQDAAAWAALGHARFALHQPEAALGAWRTASALAPDDATLYYLTGVAQIALVDLESAERSLSRAIDLDLGFSPAYADRGLARLLAGRPHESLADLDRAYELDPRHTRAMILRARALRQLNDTSAETELARALAAEPGDEQSAVSRGLMRLDDPSAAIRDFESALRWNPHSLDAMQNLAFVYAERLNDALSSMRWLDALLESHPQHTEARTSRAVLHARLGRREAALADAREALSRELSPALRYQLAGAFAHSAATHPEDAAQAIELLRDALRAGYGHDLIPTDRDLLAIRSDARFAELVQAVEVIVGSNRRGSAGGN